MENLKIEIREFLQSNKARKILTNIELNLRFVAYHSQIFKRDFCSACPGQLEDAYNELLNFTISNTQVKMSGSKFSLRKDSVIYDNISHSHYSNKNLTDEAALNLLASNPRYVKSFETLPDNWEKMVEEHILSLEISKEEKANENNADNGESGDIMTLEQYSEFVHGCTKKALQKECKKLNLPSSEWGTFSQEKLAEYLISKFQAVKAA